MISVIINSFNEEKFKKCATRLASKIQHICTVIIVYGGCNQYNYESNNNLHEIHITQNLSDHNAYVGIKWAVEQNYIDIQHDTFLYLHDTCKISTHFINKLDNIRKININDYGWIFAQRYGLYNIGICSLKFIMQRAKDFDHIDFLPKTEGIRLEQGSTINIYDKEIKPLVHYSKYTLAKATSSDITDLDSYSIGQHNIHDTFTRSYCYIGSLGIYKYFSHTLPFLIPIFPNELSTYNTKSEYLKTKNKMKCYTYMIPLLHYTHLYKQLF